MGALIVEWLELCYQPSGCGFESVLYLFLFHICARFDQQQS